MSWCTIAVISTIAPSKPEQPRTPLLSSPCVAPLCLPSSFSSNAGFKKSSVVKETVIRSISRSASHICRAAGEYKFPDPIPEFADAETKKFRAHLLNKLSKRDRYEDLAEDVVDVCTEIFSTFLHTEYGGPGTLLVVPFIDMAEMVHERGLPGASQAARAAVKWATKHVDKDWKEWTGTDD